MAISITPTVGKVYSIKFESPFSVFDGIYHVGQILTFQEIQQTGIDISSSFYIPAGKTESDLTTDLQILRYDKFLKLLNPTTLETSTALYAPTHYISEELDPRVKEYKYLAMTLKLGIFPDKDQLSYLVDALQQQVVSTLGITNDPILFTLKSAWMTEASYDSIDADRKQQATSAVTYYSENLKLQQDLVNLRAKLAAYEELIIQLTPDNTSEDK